MYRNAAARLTSLVASIGAAIVLAAAPASATDKPPGRTPTVGFAARHAKSPRLSAYRAVGPVLPRPHHEIPNEAMPKKGAGAATRGLDPVVQGRFGLSQPEASVQFEGASEDDNVAVLGQQTVPPDTEGDVGPNHYVQYINNVAVMYDKSGNIAFGPIPGNAFWAGLGGPCEIQNDGDPLVRYDRQADRWVFSQFALPNFPDGPFYQCFAVSTTNDPTGEYWQYEFKTSDTFFTDYGKLGVWPDAYYMTFNMFGPAGEFQGGAYAFDRAAMLAGAPAGMIAFDTGAQGGALPSDLDGPTPPPAGSPNYFMTFDVHPARLLEWQFHVDWTTPANSTFTGPVEIPVAEFVYPVCDASRSQCIPQFETSERLESLDDKLMYRLVYRNFGDHESLVVNHTVGTPAGAAAPRWYEIRSPGETPVLYQQGTYAPDATFRWMGSIAMDGNGNIALGYSKSSSTMYPSIGITGRLAGDPLGLMGAEDVWLAGGGSQIASFSRWGDYSTMSIDPSDDCTFWYTQEYYAESGGFDFKTRIGAFRFASCTGGPAGSLEGTVTGNSGPIAGATVEAAPQTAASGASSTTTDDAGHYQFLTLPAGAYDVTASKYAYMPSTAANVQVAAGANTVQDLALTASVSVLVNGTVKDGSGHGWPLYARLDVSGPNGFPGKTLFTEPVTGYYQITLPSGFTYDFAVTSLVPGYAPGGGPLVLAVPPGPSASGGVVANWTVAAAPGCTAPGYGPGTFANPPALSEGFDAGVVPPGWNVHTVSGTSWKVRSGADDCGQFDDNRTGGAGPYAIINSACESLGTPDDSFLETSPIDLTGRSSAAIRWATDVINFGSGAISSVDASADGGVTWRNIWRETGPDLPGPGTQIADMSFAAGHADARARFHYEAFFGGWWQVDDVTVGAFTCDVLPGGLVVGHVTDTNTGAALNGATVLNLPNDGSTTTFATPDDPDQGDGFYALFAGSGSQPFEASYPAYEPLDKNTTVIPNSTVRLDFALKAGRLSASPRPLSLFMSPGATQELTLNLTNTGTASGSYVIREVDVPPSSLVPGSPATFADPADVRAALRRVPFSRRNDPNRSGVPAPPKAPTDVPQLAQGGNVIGSFPTGLSEGRGLAYDTDADKLWISDPNAPEIFVFGDGFDHQYLPDGTSTGDTIDIHDTGGLLQADGTYNGRTGKLWQVNVGGDNCLFEMDPVAKVVTGRKICGSWTAAASQRAVAYDYATDTYYVGGNNEATVYHIDGSGTVLDSRYVGLGMVGLAFNPSTRHLFALTEFASPFDVWVLDAADQYNVLGGFIVTDGGAPVLQNEGINLEADCNGHLLVNTRFSQIVYEFESGETGWCVNDIPWLSETPSAGSVPEGGALPVAVTFDPSGLLPGLRQGSLIFTTDTPTGVDPVPVDLTVLFNDVPQGSFAWNSIYGAAGAGVMPGCAPQTPTFTFCPNQVVTRRTMAGFIERAVHGALTPPPVYLGEFGDVASGSFNANYIQGLVEDGITAGCNVAPPLYCPDVPVTRAQMAVFVWKGGHGSQPPPPCTPPGTFGDVPCPGGFAVDYIEGIYSEGVTAGCGSGDFCPDASITNAQMAVFLVKAFAIPNLP